MKKLLFTTAMICLATAATARADAPAYLPVQGILAAADGTPVDGETSIRFALYASEIGGTELWFEPQTVLVDEGLFTVYLGDVNPLDLAFFRDNGNVWLGVQVGTDAEMDRIQLATTGFAAFAQYSGDAATLAGHAADEFQLSGAAVDWTDLTGVPADLADGTDNDTTYSAGAGLALTGTVFSADQTAVEGWARGVCYDTAVELRADLDSVYAPLLHNHDAAYAAAGHDHDAAYVNTGEPNSITSAMIVDGSVGGADINTTTVQARITGCAAGSYIQTVAADGTATCVADQNSSVPTGVISAFAGTAAPTGYLMCDGTAISRVTFATLFAAIGTTYGPGDGSSTFNLPNLRGRVPVGLDAATPVFNALNNRGGEITHTLTVAELVAHGHTGAASTAGDHTHLATALTAGAFTPAGSISTAADHAHTASTGTAGDHLHNLALAGGGWFNFEGTTTAPGGGTTGPYAIPFIRNADGTSYNDGAYDDMVFYNASSGQFWNRDTDWIPIHFGTPNATTSAGTHIHTVTVNAAGAHGHTFTGTAVAAHTHTVTNTTAGAHTHTVTVGNTGSGTPFNVLQPYVVVNYIIKS